MELTPNPLKDLTPNEQLNEVLQLLIEGKQLTVWDVCKHFYEPEADIVQAKQIYISEIMLFLCDEGYAKPNSASEKDRKYSITFKGIQFIKDGGYVKRYEREEERAKKLHLENEDRKSALLKANHNAERLNDLTEGLKYAGWAAAAGTAFLGLMELIKLIPSHWHCH